jgi:hypothetical protein
MAPSDKVAQDITRLISIQIGIASFSGYLQCESVEDPLVFWQHAQHYRSLDHKASADWSASLQIIYDLYVREIAHATILALQGPSCTFG